MKALRPYQELGINKLASKVAQGKRKLIFQLATGGGKTVTFAGLLNRFMAKQQKRVLILVHREELMKQALSTLYQWYDIVAAPVTAGNNFLPNMMVYVSMVETANNRLKKNPKYFGNVGLVIVDECHIGNFKKLYDLFPESIIIGFTATPISGSKKDPLKNHFEDIVCGIDIPDLIAQGSLVPNKTFHLKNINRKELKVTNGEFDEKEMGRMFSGTRMIQNTIAAYKSHAPGTKAIIFNCNIEHSKKVTEAFVSFGFKSRHLDGETPTNERAAIFKWFKETPDAILNNVGVATTGFDEPSVLTVIVNKSTMSLPLWLQMTGIGSRPFPGKEHFTIIDMGSNAITHGDWCESRNWYDEFHNPDKPKEGGVAPVKECIGCSVLIALSCKICPHCGAVNTQPARYDDEVVALELLNSKAPFTIDLPALIGDYTGKLKSDGKPYSDYAILHEIKRQLIFHAQRIWRLKKVDDKTADRLITIYNNHVREWCRLKDKGYSSVMEQNCKEWIMEALKQTFNYEPQKKVA